MTSRQDELAAWLGGSRLEEQVASGSGTITSTIYGTAVGDSSNGSVEVVFTGDVVNYEDEDGVVHGTNTVELPTEIDVREGDEVRIVAVGPDGFKHLAVAGVLGGGDRTQEAIDAAQEAATEAQEAIDAQEQICWKDTNGVHIAEDQEQTGANFLANSLGVILRLGQNILSAMTASAFTIYDGLGNAAENIIATFGERIILGKTNSAGSMYGQTVIDNGKLSIFPWNGDTSGLEMGHNDESDPEHLYGYLNGAYMNIGSGVAADENELSGMNELAVGVDNTLDHENCAAIGQGNTILAADSFASGSNNLVCDYTYSGGPTGTVSGGDNCALIGRGNTTNGNEGKAIGQNNAANDRGIAIGTGLLAEQDQIVLGKYNDNTTTHPFVIGDGADANNRSNGFYIDSSGDAYANGGKLATAGTTLWSSASGSNLSTAVNLSDSIANYKFIEVVYAVYGSNVRYTGRAAVYHNNNTHSAWVRLLTVSSIVSNQIVLFTGTINASGSSASSSDVNTVTLKTTPSVAIASSSNLRVYEIIGYK